MVGRHGAHLGGQFGPSRGGQLVGVDLRLQAVRQPRAQDPPCLVPVEGHRFAEHVAESREAGFGHSGQPFLDDGLNQGAPARPGFGRDRMGTQEGRHQVGGRRGLQVANGLEDLHFRRQVQAVPGLHLDRGDAPGQEVPDPRHGQVHQFGTGGCAGGSHGPQDAPAEPGDFLVGGPGGASLEFIRARTRVDQVRVAFHQAWRDQPAPGIQGRDAIDGTGRQVRLGPGPGDVPVPDHDRGIPDPRGLGPGLDGKQPADPSNDERPRRRPLAGRSVARSLRGIHGWSLRGGISGGLAHSCRHRP